MLPSLTLITFEQKVSDIIQRTIIGHDKRIVLIKRRLKDRTAHPYMIFLYSLYMKEIKRT